MTAMANFAWNAPGRHTPILCHAGPLNPKTLAAIRDQARLAILDFNELSWMIEYAHKRNAGLI
jgi:hypothetical protein